jgi:adenosylcobyric acid synthase
VTDPDPTSVTRPDRPSLTALDRPSLTALDRPSLTGPASWNGALMVCGTASDAGKSTLVTGLCRLLARSGVRVAPFKAQNMALNSAVTPSGHEIGRAQAAQAQAAGVAPEVAMNPILLKPQSDRTSQVVVMGRPWRTLDAAGYHAAKPELAGLVLEQLDDLRARFDVVICEGAGSPAEINLLDGDIVNLRIARDAGLPAIIVGDIDRGGVFAALYGTVALLPDDLRACVAGFVINKFRGDPALLGSGPGELARRTGIPTLGVLPWLGGLGLDAEDSLALGANWPAPVPSAHAPLDVAAIRFPRISNFTDLDALAIEPGVSVRLVETAAALGRPDLLVLPGTKSTVADLAWLRDRGLADAITSLAANPAGGTTILGICGGYQMLGSRIHDAVEARPPETVAGLGVLAAVTVFETDKVTQWTTGVVDGEVVRGYEIHHGRTTSATPWIQLDGSDQGEGCVAAHGRLVGTSLHGLLENDAFRAAFLGGVARRAGRSWAASGVSFAAAREARFDRLAAVLEDHLDLDAVGGLVARARRPAAQRPAAQRPAVQRPAIGGAEPR